MFQLYSVLECLPFSSQILNGPAQHTWQQLQMTPDQALWTG